ncbi:uncharacterized protein LOC129189271 [Dunckerocampus dactyliophorus]|uniref:uncharacterized protein LOC129189271 n=1 Tax=Dunckerocampus dactyliophorus TaxID=161453 RepID=UPI002406FC19|nr:uncharacterized protein LOC129189271 [Dunckerocampus dactyliophorus]
MWRGHLFACFYLAALVTSQDVTIECREYDVLPPTRHRSPSLLADLKVELVKVSGKDMMNVSWAINIDASIEYLIGTRLRGETDLLCEYTPPLAKADITGSHQKWFHYLVKANYGSNLIQAANLPLPPQGSGPSYKSKRVFIPRPTHSCAPKPTYYPKGEETLADLTTHSPRSDPTHTFNNILVIVYLGLAVGMILTSGCILYKRCGRHVAFSLGFKRLPTSARVPVSVLMVYPPESRAFQKAVMALAEFLQKHAGCSVAIDVWQQGRIAQVGPMRWLVEEVKAAEHVLIISPQPSYPAPSNLVSTGPSTPASAHDLYPLALNMVASHAKNANELAKFWVLQLGKHQDKSYLAPELSACKRFCLLKDLRKLCRSLHTLRQDGKMRADLVFGPDSGKCTVKLRDAVEKLSRDCVVISREAQALNSVITV